MLEIYFISFNEPETRWKTGSTSQTNFIGKGNVKGTNKNKGMSGSGHKCIIT